MNIGCGQAYLEPKQQLPVRIPIGRGLNPGRYRFYLEFEALHGAVVDEE